MTVSLCNFTQDRQAAHAVPSAFVRSKNRTVSVRSLEAVLCCYDWSKLEQLPSCVAKAFAAFWLQI